MDGKEIVELVTASYLDSYDFNGLSVSSLCELLDCEWTSIKSIIVELIEAKEIRMLNEALSLNPMIIRTGFPDPAKQVEKLEEGNKYHTCLYPSEKVLEGRISERDLLTRPYWSRLALGKPQLSPAFFDLSVLEFYRNDPRYYYQNNDIDGFVSVKDEFLESENMQDHDKELIESFGFGYDDEMNRCVAVYLRYLSSLSPEHQSIWKAKEVSGSYKLHPDYWAHTQGDWGRGTPILQAIRMEISLINKMSLAISRPPLFRMDFGENGNENVPPGLALLVRPTQNEYQSFILLLDKMLSDNINKKFFRDDVETEEEHVRKDGKIEVRQKGTIALLDEWIRKRFRTDSWERWTKGIDALKDVRRERQKPAHRMNEDMFDQTFISKQRELLERVYDGILSLRLILGRHPGVVQSGITAPEALKQGIWSY